MKHIRHEEFGELFVSMLKKMETLGCPKEALIVLGQKIGNLWDAILKNEIREPKNGFFSFIPIIPFNIVSAQTQIKWINGSILEEITNPIIQITERPNEPYFMIGVNMGDFRGYYITKELEPVSKIIEGSGFVPCSDEEIIALCLHGKILSPNLKALNTRYGKDGAIPHIAVFSGSPKFYWKIPESGISISDIPSCSIFV